MKTKRLFTAVIMVCTAASWLVSCDDKTPSEIPAGDITVMTAPAKVALPEVTLPGFFTGSPTDVTSAGFMWGLAQNELTQNAEAVITGNDFSATITIGEEGYNTTYYYRGYVVSKGKTILCPETKSFSTDHGDKLQGKKWLELPVYTVADGQVAKTYYSTFNGNVNGRSYSILYDPDCVLSLWVAFPMNKDIHLGSLSTSYSSWAYDNDIPAVSQAYLNNSYVETAYERGHQIARADRNCTTNAIRQTYISTNSTPQLSGFNGGIWGSLESAIRNVVKNNSLSRDTLYVVTGPMMSASPQMAHDKDGKECPIPEKYFKVVLWSKYVSDDERSYDMIGFIMENKSGQSGYENYALSVGEVEKETGFAFFGNLGLGAAETTALKNTSSWREFSTR